MPNQQANRTSSDLQQLVDQVRSLTPANQLRLAAGLIEKGQPETAEMIANMALEGLQLKRLFAKAAPKSWSERV